MILIDGKKVAAEMKLEIAAKVELMKKSSKKTPHLAAILVGHDGGSETYVAYKIKDCAEVGYKSSLFRFEDDVKEDALLNKKMMILTDLLFSSLYPGISQNRK
jgi:methylenetetrahydrofolate dehydrogenase (NADP+)/methenyltetrahydrofolate cyclohydrolase